MYYSDLVEIICEVKNTYTFRYNPANEKVATILPATAQIGNGHGWIHNEYAYIGGPLNHTTIHDESGAKFRTVNYGYDAMGNIRTRGQVMYFYID